MVDRHLSWAPTQLAIDFKTEGSIYQPRISRGTPPILVDDIDVAVQKKDEKARFVQTPVRPESPAVILFKWRIEEA